MPAPKPEVRHRTNPLKALLPQRTSVKWTIFAAKVTISATILVYLFHKVGFDAVMLHLLSANPIYIVISSLFLLAQFLVLTEGWIICLRFYKSALERWDTFKIVVISLFFNQVVPASIGGMAARTYFAYIQGMRPVPAAASVTMDRICNVTGLITLVIAGSFVLYIRSPQAFSLREIPIAIAILVFGLGILILLGAEKALDRIGRRRSTGALHALTTNLRAFFFAPWLFARAIAWGILWHSLSVAALFSISHAFSANVPTYTFIALLPLALLLSIVPLSIGGWGLREGAMVAILQPVGLATDQILSISVTYGFLLLATRLPGALFWLSNAVGRGYGPSSALPKSRNN